VGTPPTFLYFLIHAFQTLNKYNSIIWLLKSNRKGRNFLSNQYGSVFDANWNLGIRVANRLIVRADESPDSPKDYAARKTSTHPGISKKAIA